MPKRKRSYTYRRRRKRRGRYRKRRFRRYKNSIPRKGPLPNVFFARLSYFEKALSLDPGPSIPAQYIFSANSVFDPNITAAGHQPRGFDQIAALFNNYEVYGSKITITPTTHQTSHSYLWTLGLNDDSAWSNLTFIPENPHVRFFNDQALNTNLPRRSLTLKCNPHKFLGRKRGDSVMYSSVGASPNQQAYFIVTLEDVGTADPVSVGFSAYISYYVKFFDPISIGPS